MAPGTVRQYEIRSHLFVTHGTAYDFGSFQQYEAAVRNDVKSNELYAKRTFITSSMKTKLAHSLHQYIWTLSPSGRERHRV